MAIVLTTPRHRFYTTSRQQIFVFQLDLYVFWLKKKQKNNFLFRLFRKIVKTPRSLF